MILRRPSAAACRPKSARRVRVGVERGVSLARHRDVGTQHLKTTPTANPYFMFGVNTERKIRGPVREMRAGRVWGAARCLPRGQGLCSRTVAMSQALEDRATTPRWRVLPQIVLSGVGG